MRDFDIDWDTDDTQDRSWTPSPVAIVDEPHTGSYRGNIRHAAKQTLGAGRVLEAGMEPHREDEPEKVEREEKETQTDENTPSGDLVCLLWMGNRPRMKK